MAEALLDTLGNSQDTLATKADLNALQLAIEERSTKADLNALQQTVQALHQTVQNLQQTVDTLATKAELRELAQATKSEMRELELRMTVKVGAMLFAMTGLLVALQLLPR